MPDKHVRFGLIGYGLFGKHQAHAISANDAAHVTAIAAPSEQSQSAARETHPAADVCGDYRLLVERDDIDVVDIVAPNHLHYEIARAALEAGKHVFLEKPMALELRHCDELVELAQANGRVLAVNHELRLSTLWGGVKRLIDDGAIGRPQFAMIELSRFPYRQGAQGWRYDIDRVGNWILEEPIHFFDLARWYLADCGEPTSIYARANSRHADHPELRDNFTAIVNYSGGEYALVSQTLSAFEHHVTAKIAGTVGTIWAHWSAPDARSDKPSFSLRYGLGETIREVCFAEPTGELVELAAQIAAIVNCVRDGREPPCTGRDGRWSTLLCLAAQQSVDSQEIVAIDKFVRDNSISEGDGG